jgi:hypothetical protein
VDKTLHKLSAYRLVQSRHSGYRALLVFAATLAAGLGAAGPAFATDLPAPPPVPEVTPVVPEPAAPPISIPAIPVPDLDIEPVVVTQVEAGNIDVSVRVLSPGEDGTVTQESATGVVSPDAPTDITATLESTDVANVESAPPASGTNTNVSIRVLSPGGRGDVTQTTPGSGEEVVEAGTDPPLPHVDPAPASAAPPEAPLDSSQYQLENSQYQSNSEIKYYPWNWTWLLSLDCSGNLSTISTETGHQESLVWSWEWIWEWCSGAEASESSADSGARASPSAAAGQPAGEAGTSSPTSEAAVTEPWVWAWTFTFCGETRTISTRTGTGTPLTWTWDWIWTWTCPNAAAPDVQLPPAVDASPPLVTSPPAAGGVDDSAGEAPRTPQVAYDAPQVTLPTVWLPTLPSGVEPGAPVEVVVVPPMPTIEVEVPIPPVVLPTPSAPSLPLPATPFPVVHDPVEPTTITPATPPPARRTTIRQARPAAPVAYSPAEIGAQLPHSQPRAHHARPIKQTRAHAERPNRERQELPLGRRQVRQALGSSSAGGVIPSALLFGFAALTGFVVFAAPGLGRRIRVARELSPRSPDQSPIDHPG